MNWKRGFLRVTVVVSVLGGLVGWVFAAGTSDVALSVAIFFLVPWALYALARWVIFGWIMAGFRATS